MYEIIVWDGGRVVETRRFVKYVTALMWAGRQERSGRGVTEIKSAPDPDGAV